MRRHLGWIVLLGGLAGAQGFFAPLEQHPSLRQAYYGVLAAEANVRALESPVALQGQAGLASLGYAPPPADCQPGDPRPACYTPPSDARSLSLSLTLTPFPFGDVADNLTQARVGLEQAKIGYRQARAQLEAQALEAAYRRKLAEGAVGVAQSGLRLAQGSLEATRLRQSREAASASEVRQAEAGVRQAQSQLDDAQRNLELAGLTLREFFGTDRVEPVEVPVPRPFPAPAVLQAELQVIQAQLAFDRALRNALPVVQGSYSWYPSSTSTWSLSLNSRTLQPALGFSYLDPNPGRSSPPQDRLRSEWRVGLSFSLTPALFDAIDAGERQLEAARAGLEAAKRNAALQEQALRASLAAAERGLGLAQSALADGEKALNEARERERLGLTSPLATLQAELAAQQARLGLEQARLARAQRLLDLYRFYALPPSEVTP